MLTFPFCSRSLPTVAALGATVAAVIGVSAQPAHAQSPAAKAIGITGAEPNEAGRIPILMYHSVGDPPLTGKMAKFNKLGLSISAGLFRKHLEMLYDAGFYPVNVRDIFMNRLDIPKGKSPVALTFDDARVSQFRYLKNGHIDPNCVTGILEAFHKKHGSDWPQRASFYVLPASKYNPVPFGQAGKDGQKFKFLVDAGYEVANHSTSHTPFSRMDSKRLAWEMTFCKNYVMARAPKATMDTMALPYGIGPSFHAGYDIIQGGAGASYHNKCILLAAGDASYSPLDKRLNVQRVMRVGSEPGVIERWIVALKRNRTAPSKITLRPYISDGDPSTVTVLKSQSKWLVNARLNGAKLVTINDVPAAQPKSKPKAQVATAAGRRPVR